MAKNLLYRSDVNPPTPGLITDENPKSKGSPLTYAEMDYNWNRLAETKVDVVPGKGLSSVDFSPADKTKLDGIAEGANNYAHPTTDGNLHVPATGTSNNGKVLKAGSTPGSISWGSLSPNDVGLGSVANRTEAEMVAGPGPIKSAFDSKASSAHGHLVEDISGLGDAAEYDVGTAPLQIPTNSIVESKISTAIASAVTSGQVLQGNFLFSSINLIQYSPVGSNVISQWPTGWLPGIDLQLGDVIKISIPSVGYEKIHTISLFYASGSAPWIGLNTQHTRDTAGYPSKGPMAFPAGLTGHLQGTITKIAKWHSAGSALGQRSIGFNPTMQNGTIESLAYPAPASSTRTRRFNNSSTSQDIYTYRNDTNRAIVVNFTASDGSGGVYARVDGVDIFGSLWDIQAGPYTFSFVVPPDAVYSINLGRNNPQGWRETC